MDQFTEAHTKNLELDVDKLEKSLYASHTFEKDMRFENITLIFLLNRARFSLRTNTCWALISVQGINRCWVWGLPAAVKPGITLGSLVGHVQRGAVVPSGARDTVSDRAIANSKSETVRQI